ncbi:hypothetical protein MBM_08381 [Drepanopeziza brunnea f. sp. 'multigermtubi' MB_m1]|uniref:Uncharacterized protein n=1 Tax=Marssonina brunnea f. sp. multigermtubi (strain MB_m1) TaxID=1072389 RepID=K1WX85_MARBU|nr:uncharacterized protein MBM_08381 [Drepanopeziza brunnea f. sp. 'multigermtubi' MB_m1]EKD13298.1 hypothetical protein MBM_08381 [Drepanopeziza brunnea f. sp. 'multigermtubi' MB_m1]
MAQTRVQHDARNESEQPTEPVQVPGAFSSREGRTAVSSPASNQSSRCQRSERRKIAYPPMKARKVCAEESFFQGTTMQAPTTAVIMHPRSMLIRFGNVTLKSFAADAELAVVFFLAALAPRNQKSCHDQLARIKRENGLDHDRYILGAIGVLDSKPEHGKNSTTYSRKVCEIVSERGSKATKKGVWSLAPVAPLGTMGMATQRKSFCLYENSYTYSDAKKKKAGRTAGIASFQLNPTVEIELAVCHVHGLIVSVA